jgi:molybdopterin biosynthesis enzyme
MCQTSHKPQASRVSNDDVRMRGFAKRQTLAEALYWLDSQTRPLPMEVVPLHAAAGRVLATALVSKIDVPGFDRAMMDGYAVAAESTDGAASYTPVPLTVIGESMPGSAFSGTVALAQAVRIMTGAPMPDGSDSVLLAEWAESANPPEAMAQCADCRLSRQERGKAWRRYSPRNYRT